MENGNLTNDIALNSNDFLDINLLVIYYTGNELPC